MVAIFFSFYLFEHVQSLSDPFGSFLSVVALLSLIVVFN